MGYGLRSANSIKGENAYHVVSASGITNTVVLDGFTITAGNVANSATYQEGGGGMYADNSKITLRNVTFSGNKAYEGGGMYNESSSPILTDVTFSGNMADLWGGGMENVLSSPSLTDVTFSGNSASDGGGMLNKGGSPHLTNVTFSGNKASAGGGMYNDRSSPHLTNAILWGNTPDQIYNDAITPASTPTITYSDIQAGVVFTGTGNINGDPLFVDAAKGDLHLQSTSPAIDAGDNAAPGLVGITTDLDGNPRKVDVPGVKDTGSGSAPIVDMGAYEHPYVPVQIFLPLLARH